MFVAIRYKEGDQSRAAAPLDVSLFPHMVELLASFRPKMMSDEEILRRARSIRRNRPPKPTFDTVTADHAKTAGYSRATTGYALRQHDQIAALQAAIGQLTGTDFCLVLHERRISIWRRNIRRGPQPTP